MSASSFARFGRTSVALVLVWMAGSALRAATEVDPDVEGSMPEDYFPALKTMIDQALKQAPSLIVYEMNIEVAQAQRLYIGISPLLPSVHGYATGGEEISAVANNAAASNHSSGFYYDITAGQPIFVWGQLKNGLEAQNIAVAINRRNYATVYQQFVQNLRQTYLGLIASKIALRNAQFTLELRKRALDAVQQQLKAGVVTASYAMGPEMDEEGAQIAEETSEQVYLFARRQLARMIGWTDVTDEEIPSTVPPPKFSTAAAAELTADVLRTGARYTPDAQIALLNIRNWELQYKINKVNLLPRISAQIDVNQQNQSTVQSGLLYQTAVTNETYYLRADWNIFDGLATRGRKQEALIHRRQAERDLKMKVDVTLDSAQNSQKMVELAWRQLALTTKQDGINRATLTKAEEDLAAHIGSSEAVAGARANAYLSEYNLTVSRSSFLAQWTNFVALVGHDPAINNLSARYVRPIP